MVDSSLPIDQMLFPLEQSILSPASCDELLANICKRPLDLQSPALVLPDVHPSNAFAPAVPEIVSDSEGSEHIMSVAKKRKISNKRAQMKYEPPTELAAEMSKEEVKSWRRVRWTMRRPFSTLVALSHVLTLLLYFLFTVRNNAANATASQLRRLVSAKRIGLLSLKPNSFRGRSITRTS
jgi:hypothetical protein